MFPGIVHESRIFACQRWGRVATRGEGCSRNGRPPDAAVVPRVIQSLEDMSTLPRHQKRGEAKYYNCRVNTRARGAQENDGDTSRVDDQKLVLFKLTNEERRVYGRCVLCRAVW